MSTQPMNEYLNRERLSDFAQFAVPDGHDLWPKIEQAARASASGMSTPKPGILSLGLSRAWTAVGIFFIAATFAALGFGLAVLVLSNGHGQVPAAQLEVTPAPTAPTASPTPSVSKDPTISQGSAIPSREAAHAKMETILSGETLDKYRTLPPAYQEALGLYTWHNLPPSLVRSAVKDKIDQWGDDWIIPLPEFIGEERAERFDELEGEILNHAHLLVSYYVLVLNTEPPDLSRSVALREFMDYVAPLDTEMPSTSEPDKDTSRSVEAPMVAWPSLETVLTNTALARLDMLGARLRESVMDTISSSGEDDIKNVATFLTLYELFLLKAQPGLEMPSLEETLTGDDLATFKNSSEADRDSAESFFQRGLFNLHYVGAAGHPPNSTIPDPTPHFLADQAALAMQWVLPTVNSEALRFRGVDPPPLQTATPTSADKWVSENGFIQFTTGTLEDLFDEPLPGTHPQCIPPTTPPEQPGPWLVPTKLPDGMEQEVRDQMFPGTMYRAFRRPMDHVSMEQGLCAIRQLNPAMYRAIQIGDRTAYVTAGRGQPAGGSAPAFDPNEASSLIMDIGYGVVSFNVFGSVTVDELVAMAASLVPEELTEAEQGPYPQAVLEELGTGFGPVYVPSKLPDGYEMFGQMQARQEAMGPKTARLYYVRTSDNYCVFRLNQAGLRRQFPDVVQKAQRGDETTYTTTDESGQTVRATAKWGTVEIDGVTIYAQEFSAQPRNEYTDVYFQSQGVWFNLTISTSSYCDHSLEMVAEIAASLEPIQPYTKPTAQEADTGTPLIAFHSNRDGNWNIYVMNADGSDQTRLTEDPAADSWPNWSPDGRRIAFISPRDDPDPNDDHPIWEIYVMNADGSGQTRLTNDSAWHSLPRWSPDGRRIAFQSYTDENWEIHVMNADGSDQRRLTDNLAWDGMPSWSPDSQRIAFHTTIDENAEIYVMNADGSDQANLTNDAANDWSPSWSPDGRRIAFHSHRDGNSEIYIMNADGSDQTRLTNNPARDIRPVWSSDGRSIAFTSNRDYPAPDDDYDISNIYVMNPDGSGLTRLTNES
ncbi:MAG: DUF5050 domain-containing protein, partial [Dehalococcoidia bacterium]|nr:DUF5050 domain-containing protein [Dehalococcoidia bacterium]